MDSLLNTFTSFDVTIFFKFAVCLLIFMYVIFTLILFSHVKSLERIVIIKNSFGHTILQSFGLIYSIASCVLFLLSLVIL